MKSSISQRRRNRDVEAARERFISVDGPPVTRLPDWGFVRRTADCEFHLLPPVSFEAHYQVDRYVLVMFFSAGELRAAFANEKSFARETTRPGELRLVPPNVRVRVVAEKPLEYLLASIASARFHAAADRASGATGWAPGPLRDHADGAVEALAREMRRAMLVETIGAEPYLDALVDAVVARLAIGPLAVEPRMLQCSSKETLAPHLLRRVVDVVEERLSEGAVPIGDLAAVAGLSRAHFSRAFANAMGEPPSAYVMGRRVARARELLSSKILPVTDIALQCGFANPSHMTTAFRKEIGLAPLAYRRSAARNL